MYAAQEADSYVQGTKDDPHAFDYDYHYDRQKANAESLKEARKAENRGVTSEKERPKSRFLSKIQ